MGVAYFLALMKDSKEELVDLAATGEARDELCQVLYDLHGLHFFRNQWIIYEHGDADPEPFTKKTAIRLLPFLVSQTVENLLFIEIDIASFVLILDFLSLGFFYSPSASSLCFS